MKRILVTGAAGFLGRHTLGALVERGYEVHAVGLKDPQPELVQLGVEWHRADLMNPGDLVADVGPSHLLHLAWYTEHEKFWASLENLRWLEASVQLLRAFVDAGGERICGVGSCSEYNWDYGYCSESVTPCQPASLYGATKNAFREVLDAVSSASDLSRAWGRVFFTYGPHEHPNRLVASLATSLLEGRRAQSSMGTQIRDFLHARDVAGALVALADSDVTGPVNIGSGKPTSIADVVRALGEITGRQDLLDVGTLPMRPGEPPMILADVRRLTDEVGWTPSMDLREGLTDVTEWLMSQGIGEST